MWMGRRKAGDWNRWEATETRGRGRVVRGIETRGRWQKRVDWAACCGRLEHAGEAHIHGAKQQEPDFLG